MFKRILIVILLLSCALPLSAQTSIENTGSLSATGSIVLNAPGAGGVAFQVTGTWVGTITFEGSIDCLSQATATYVSLNVFPPSSSTAQTTTTSNGVFQGAAAGLSCMRARMSSYTSGTAVINIRSATSSARSNVTGPACAGCLVSGGALGTPSSGTATNITGLPLTGIVAGADDTVPVSNGSILESKAISSCSTASSALTYNTTTNAFGCNSISASVSWPLTVNLLSKITAVADDANSGEPMFAVYPVAGTEASISVAGAFTDGNTWSGLFLDATTTSGFVGTMINGSASTTSLQISSGSNGMAISSTGPVTITGSSIGLQVDTVLASGKSITGIYKSSDGSSGITQTCSTPVTAVTVKNGLIVAITCP